MQKFDSYINVQRQFTLGTSNALLQVKRDEVEIVKEIGCGASGLASKGKFRGQEVAVKHTPGDPRTTAHHGGVSKRSEDNGQHSTPQSRAFRWSRL